MSQPPPENPPPNQPPPNQPPPNQPPGYPQGGGYGAPPQKPGKGMAAAALIFGILALLSFWTVAFGVIFGLVALILGLVASSKAKKGRAGGRAMAIIGIVLGVLGLLLSAVVFALGAWLFDDAKSLAECLQDAGSDQAAIEKCQRDFEDDVENKVN